MHTIEALGNWNPHLGSNVGRSCLLIMLNKPDWVSRAASFKLLDIFIQKIKMNCPTFDTKWGFQFPTSLYLILAGNIAMVGAWLTNERQDITKFRQLGKNYSSDGIKVAYIFEPYGIVMAPQKITNKYATLSLLKIMSFLESLTFADI